jgi:pteridine reductase
MTERTGTAPLALITGGHRRLGAVIAGKLAQSGYDLALHGYRDAVPDDELRSILDKHETRWHGFAADLAEARAASTLMHDAMGHFGRAPDLLVNNASLFQYDDWQTLSEESLTSHYAINLQAPVMLAQALVAASGADMQPAIVNIIDQRVRNPNGDQLAYTLSKQALAESIRTLARAFGVRARVNGIAPGLTLPTDHYTAQQIADLAREMPLGNLSQPDDIAEAVLYLGKAKSVTGQLLFVDGGAHMVSYDRDFLFMQN